MPIIIQEQNEIRNNYLKGFIIIGSLLGLLVISGIIIATNSNNVQFNVIESGRFVHLDYEPKTILDKQWIFLFWTEEKVEGSGNYKETFYPFIASWKLYIQDFDNNKPIAFLNYNQTGEGLIHPDSKIEFKFTFESNKFEKGIYLLKFRAEIVSNVTIYREALDFHLELEGIATGAEVFLILGPTIGLGVFFIITFQVKKKMNVLFWDEVKLHTAWFYFFFYLFSFRWLKSWFKNKLRKKDNEE